jgi:hypothetical protein
MRCIPDTLCRDLRRAGLYMNHYFYVYNNLTLYELQSVVIFENAIRRSRTAGDSSS